MQIIDIVVFGLVIAAVAAVIVKEKKSTNKCHGCPGCGLNHRESSR